MSRINSPSALANKWLLRIFAIFWMVFVFVDFSVRNPHYYEALSNFKYYGMFLFQLLLFGGAAFLFSSKRSLRTLTFTNLSGWKIYSVLLLMMVSIAAAFGIANDLFENDFIERIMHLAGFLVLIHLFLFLLMMVASVTGSFLTRFLGLQITYTTKAWVDIGVGLSVLTLMMMILGAFSLLNTYLIAGIMLLILVARYKASQIFFTKSVTISLKPFQLKTWALMPLLVIFILISLHFIANLRPIPIGFDAINLYMNVPNQMASQESLLQGGQAYNWSIIMSLGFILFDSTPFALALSIFPGVLSLFILYQMMIKFVKNEWAFVLLALFYTIPYILWQSDNEAKVDLALLFFSFLVILVAYETIVEDRWSSKRFFQWEKINTPGLTEWLVMGWLAGYSFGIKYTTLFLLLALVSAALYFKGSKLAFLGGLFLGLTMIFRFKLYSFTAIEINAWDAYYLWLIFLAATIIFLGIAIWRIKQAFIPLIIKFAAFGLLFFLAFSPWVVKNIVETKSIGLNSIFYGKPMEKIEKDYTVQKEDDQKIPLFASLLSSNSEIAESVIAQRQDGQGKKNQPKIKASQNKETTNTARREEVQRFIGYEEGIAKYISLPYDLTMKINERMIYSVEIGFLLLLLIPLIMLTTGVRSLPWNILRILMILALTSLAVVSTLTLDGNISGNELKAALNQQTFHTQYGAGLHYFFLSALVGIGAFLTPVYDLLFNSSGVITFVLLALTCLLLIIAYYQSARTFSSSIRFLMAFVFAYLLLWLFIGGAIPWYGGIGLSLLFGIGIIALHQGKQVLYMDKIVRYSAIFFVGIWLFMSFLLRISDANLVEKNMNDIFYQHFFGYATGLEDAQESLARMNPAYAAAVTELNKDEGLVLKIGTHIHYFIDGNLHRVKSDDQLEYFNRLFQQNETREEITRALKKADYKYLVFSLSTAAMDNTPEKTLTKKVENLYNYLYNNKQLELIATDRIVVDPQSTNYRYINNQKVPVSNKVFGQQIISPGSAAIYKIH